SHWLQQAITAVANVLVILMRKGGAGKTTATLLLADALARFGLSVLVVDMDPQGNSSIGLGREVQLSESGRTSIGNRPIKAPADNTVCEVIESGEPGVADEAITLASSDWTYAPDDPFTRGGPLFPGVQPTTRSARSSSRGSLASLTKPSRLPHPTGHTHPTIPSPVAARSSQASLASLA